MTAHTPAVFRDLLRHHRVAAGLTQEKLAERAQLSLQAINKLECGIRTAPRPETVQALATALGLSTAEARQLEATVNRRRGPSRFSARRNVAHAAYLDPMAHVRW
jgi:transcriptional regulator with XRE-family HTH domain